MTCGIAWRFKVAAIGFAAIAFAGAPFDGTDSVDSISPLLFACEKYEPSFCSNDDMRFESMADDVVGAAVFPSDTLDDADEVEVIDSDDNICSISLVLASNGTDSMASKL